MKTRGIIALTVVLYLAVMLSICTHSVHASAVVTTDKQDYSPGDTVVISGSGFTANASVTVSVTRPDGIVNSWDVTSDGSGGFTTTYPLRACP